MIAATFLIAFALQVQPGNDYVPLHQTAERGFVFPALFFCSVVTYFSINESTSSSAYYELSQHFCLAKLIHIIPAAASQEPVVPLASQDQAVPPAPASEQTQFRKSRFFEHACLQVPKE